MLKPGRSRDKNHKKANKAHHGHHHHGKKGPNYKGGPNNGQGGGDMYKYQVQKRK